MRCTVGAGRPRTGPRRAGGAEFAVLAQSAHPGLHRCRRAVGRCEGTASRSCSPHAPSARQRRTHPYGQLAAPGWSPIPGLLVPGLLAIRDERTAAADRTLPFRPGRVDWHEGHPAATPSQVAGAWGYPRPSPAPPALAVSVQPRSVSNLAAYEVFLGPFQYGPSPTAAEPPAIKATRSPAKPPVAPARQGRRTAQVGPQTTIPIPCVPSASQLVRPDPAQIDDYGSPRPRTHASAQVNAP